MDMSSHTKFTRFYKFHTQGRSHKTDRNRLTTLENYRSSKNTNFFQGHLFKITYHESKHRYQKNNSFKIYTLKKKITGLLAEKYFV